MSDSVGANDALPLPVLARLPRVGDAQPAAPIARADAAADTPLPVLVLLDDEPGPTAQQTSIDALAEAAATPWEALADQTEPFGSGVTLGVAHASDVDAAGAAPIFRIHQWLAPYSSVIVTVAVIAAAGLLFMVASQPSAERIDYDSAWAESTYNDPSPRTPDAPMVVESVVGSPSSATETERSTLIVAQRPSAAARVETAPRELPEMTLGPPQAYPSTGSQSFEQAFFSSPEATADEVAAPEAADNETGRYERY